MAAAPFVPLTVGRGPTVTFTVSGHPGATNYTPPVATVVATDAGGGILTLTGTGVSETAGIITLDGANVTEANGIITIS